MEEQNIKQLLIKLGNFYNDNIDGLMEFYNNFDDEIQTYNFIFKNNIFIY